MKKILLGLAASLVITSTSFAATTDKSSNSGYFISGPNSQIMSTMQVPATYITVLNYSDDVIYVTQPLYFAIASGDTNTVTRNGYYGSTYLVIQDWSHSTIFHDYVCRHEILTVDNSGISYNTAHC